MRTHVHVKKIIDARLLRSPRQLKGPVSVVWGDKVPLLLLLPKQQLEHASHAGPAPLKGILNGPPPWLVQLPRTLVQSPSKPASSSSSPP